MKKILFILLFITTVFCSFASHIVGGEVFYKYLGPGSQTNTSRYEVSLRLFTTCGQVCGGNTGVACPPTSVTVGIFTNSFPYSRVSNISLPLTEQPSINLSTYPICIDVKPTVCYKVNTYSTNVELTNNAVGYRLSYQSCCRAAAVNVVPNGSNTSGQPGATYEATLPGTGLVPTGSNSTAVVNLKDTALICYNSPFKLEFSASDPDKEDSLSYEFVDAYDGGDFTSTTDDPPGFPLYGTILYNLGFSGNSPLGPTVSIDPKTGIISGISPATTGKYVVNVIVKEWRKGINIAEHRKDFLITVNDCSVPDAELLPRATTCDGFTVYFKNDGSSGNIETFYWDFGEPASGNLNTSTAETPDHKYLAAGIYTVKLIVNKDLPCTDSAKVEVKVFPGFVPDFEVLGKCANTNIQFNDKTVADFGSVNSWAWNFGDNGSASNTSTLQFPTHIYATPGNYTVTLLVGSDKGCQSAFTKEVEVLDKPPLQLSPHDTLICSIDTLQLHAIGDGTLLWQPNYMINDINSHTPLVSPDVTTKYYVHITDPFGCTGIDSVTVRVVNFVTLVGPKDTTICGTDDIFLQVNSDALQYIWTSVPHDPSISDTTAQSPTATPASTTTYHVVGNISNKCFAQDDITVKVVPYPIANAGPDIPVCFPYSTQLNASGGVYYNWSPALFLSATNIADPRVVDPTKAVTYIVSVRDTLGCPKAVRDTIRVDVIRIKAYAGPDTSVVLGQPLQLNATGGTHYVWGPDMWLSDINSPAPISLPQNNIRYFVTVSDDNGCTAIDDILVRLYRVGAGLYVPNAFTPNGDGKNDIFEPIELGLKTLDLFRVYNRWGELLYSTTDMNKGWDGTYKDKGQDPATYVWYAEGTDYTGKKVQRKGSVILIRE